MSNVEAGFRDCTDMGEQEGMFAMRDRNTVGDMKWYV